MYNEIKISNDLYYIGGSDRRIALFENVYPLPSGVSYNSYLYLDKQTLVLDTVDNAISDLYFENIEHLLNGRKLDYLIISHVEPDHASNVGRLLLMHPETTIVTNIVAKRFLLNFFPGLDAHFLVVKEGDSLTIGNHSFRFLMAPFVHWPEVMFTYEEKEKVLFTADAFGTFGALNGDIHSSEYNFNVNEFRRYYTNIVGKYGEQVLATLKKVTNLDIKLIAPLHGPLHQDDIPYLLDLYTKWASYVSEDEDGVMIAYGSVYGNTANAADILASKITAKGLRNVVVYDVSKIDKSYLISEAFRVKTIVLASSTYNTAPFVNMEDFLHDFVAHNIQNRKIALVENGTWCPAANKNTKTILEGIANISYIGEPLTICSTLKENDNKSLDLLAEAIVKATLETE